MPELPITRLVRGYLHRNNRPAGSGNCAGCGTLVAHGHGEWDKNSRTLTCGDETCTYEVAALRSW